jgi:serine/threonine protein kinase
MNLYILMEYVPHGSMMDQIVWGRGIKNSSSLSTLGFYAACIVSALEHMHEVHIYVYMLKIDFKKLCNTHTQQRNMGYIYNISRTYMYIYI